MRKKLLVLVMSILTCAVFVMPVAFAAESSGPPIVPLERAIYKECLGQQSLDEKSTIYTEKRVLETGTDVGFHQNFTCSINSARYKVTLQRNRFLFIDWEDVSYTDYLPLQKNYGRIWRNVNNANLKSFRLKLDASGTNAKNAPVTGDIHILCGWFSIPDYANYAELDEPMDCSSNN